MYTRCKASDNFPIIEFFHRHIVQMRLLNDESGEHGALKDVIMQGYLEMMREPNRIRQKRRVNIIFIQFQLWATNVTTNIDLFKGITCNHIIDPS